MTYANRWTPGQEIPEEEWQEQRASESFTKNIIGISGQDEPGVPFENETLAHELYWESTGEVFEKACDFPMSHDSEILTYRGTTSETRQFLDILINFIISQRVELAVALKLNLVPEKFGGLSEEFEEKTFYFWFEFGNCTPEDLKYVDLKLRELSKPYQFLVDFLDSPLDPKFSNILDEVLEHGSFKTLYKLTD